MNGAEPMTAGPGTPKPGVAAACSTFGGCVVRTEASASELREASPAFGCPQPGVAAACATSGAGVAGVAKSCSDDRASIAGRGGCGGTCETATSGAGVAAAVTAVMTGAAATTGGAGSAGPGRGRRPRDVRRRRWQDVRVL